MGSWDFSRIGYICKDNNQKNVKELLTCMGINFSRVRGSEIGERNLMFDDATLGLNDGALEPKVIYTIVNRLFENTYILYDSEIGNDTNDSYYRYEEIYDPEKKIVHIAEIDYSYDGYEAFGESVFLLIKEECEKEAKTHNIPVKWDDEGAPDSDDFYDLCDKVLDSHGGLSALGKKERTEAISTVEIKKEVVNKIIENAVKYGYDNLTKLIKQFFENVLNEIN